MRRAFVVAAVFSLIAAFVAPAAHAGDCDGDHYTYDHGECVDLEGDAMGAVENAYDESYQRDAAMTDRDRSSGPTTGSHKRPAFSTAEMARDVAGLASFTPVSPSPGLQWLAFRTKASVRAEATREERVALAVYDAMMPAAGYDPKLFSAAAIFLTEAAYYVYSGQRFRNATFRNDAILDFSIRYARNPAAQRFTNVDKQRANDVMAVLGMNFLTNRAEAIRHHDAKALALLRSQARTVVQALWHRDPASTPLDDIACVNRQYLSCESYKYVYGGGKITPGNVFELLGVRRTPIL